MRHRIGELTGFGNSAPELLDNNAKIEKSEFWDKFLDDATENFEAIKDMGGFDFHIKKDYIFRFGVEPAYEGEDLFIIEFNFITKDLSCWEKGTAKGPYGSQIEGKRHFYGLSDDCKEKEFIRRWYDQIKEEVAKLNQGENK